MSRVLARTDSLVETTTGEKVAIATMVTGGLFLIAGAIIYGRAARKRTSGLRSALGQVQSQVKAGGMLLTHHYDPEMSIQQRVAILQDLVWKGVQNPQMRELALAITGNGERTVTVGKKTFRVRGKGCPARDGLCETEAIHDFVKREVRYTGDVAPVKMPNGKVEGVDLFQGGWRSLEFGGGDCDDHSVLTATLLALNGIPARFRITAPNKSADWSHILTVGGLPKTNPKKWVPLDTTLPGNMFGRQAPAGRAVEFII